MPKTQTPARYIMMRLSEDVAQQLDAADKENDRSRAREVAHRLRRSFGAQTAKRPLLRAAE